MTTIIRRPKLGRTSCREFAAKMTTPVRVMRHDRTNWRRYRGYPDDTTLLIRWGCTAESPIRNVLNTVEAIREVNDKTAFRAKMAEAGLSPKTFTPLSLISNLNGRNEDFSQPIWDFLASGKKLVVRPQTHAQGRNLHVVSTREEFIMAANRCGQNWYASELIDKVAEYRVFVGLGRAVWVARKTPGNPDQVAWNVARGGRFDNVKWSEWPLKAIKTAIAAFNLSQLDFGGVDVMVDANNNCYVLEINSAPSQTSPYRQSCVAKFFDYVVEHGKERLPLQEERGGWRKFILPALIDNQDENPDAQA